MPPAPRLAPCLLPCRSASTAMRWPHLRRRWWRAPGPHAMRPAAWLPSRTPSTASAAACACSAPARAACSVRCRTSEARSRKQTESVRRVRRLASPRAASDLACWCASRPRACARCVRGGWQSCVPRACSRTQAAQPSAAPPGLAAWLAGCVLVRRRLRASHGGPRWEAGWLAAAAACDRRGGCLPWCASRAKPASLLPAVACCCGCCCQRCCARDRLSCHMGRGCSTWGWPMACWAGRSARTSCTAWVAAGRRGWLAGWCGSHAARQARS
mmetsp:Transcript_40431/g.120609  ORF Transcript_40431/g.120609 Transcript_40431/m.120609 type:complete len:271 (+) Transcript_40431:3962-4774(+)